MAFHVVALGAVGIGLASERSLAAEGASSHRIEFARTDSRKTAEHIEDVAELPIDVVGPEIDESDLALVPNSEPLEELNSTDPDFDLEEFEPAPAFEVEWPRRLPNLRFAKTMVQPDSIDEALPAVPTEPIAAQLVREDLAQPDVKSGDLEPLLLEAPSPRYPSIARRRLWEGTVLCRILVATDGTVSEVHVDESAGYSVLDQAALKAIRNWRFRPGERNGEPVELVIMHRVTFRITP